MAISESKMEYLKLLAKTYKSEDETAAEIINLLSIQNLPKGTDYFMSDIHAEYEAFSHILRNASGTIKRRIDEVFTELDEDDRRIMEAVKSRDPVMAEKLAGEHIEHTLQNLSQYNIDSILHAGNDAAGEEAE